MSHGHRGHRSPSWGLETWRPARWGVGQCRPAGFDTAHAWGWATPGPDTSAGHFNRLTPLPPPGGGSASTCLCRRVPHWARRRNVLGLPRRPLALAASGPASAKAGAAGGGKAGAAGVAKAGGGAKAAAGRDPLTPRPLLHNPMALPATAHHCPGSLPHCGGASLALALKSQVFWTVLSPALGSVAHLIPASPLSQHHSPAGLIVHVRCNYV